MVQLRCVPWSTHEPKVGPLSCSSRPVGLQPSTPPSARRITSHHAVVRSDTVAQAATTAEATALATGRGAVHESVTSGRAQIGSVAHPNSASASASMPASSGGAKPSPAASVAAVVKRGTSVAGEGRCESPRRGDRSTTTVSCEREGWPTSDHQENNETDHVMGRERGQTTREGRERGHRQPARVRGGCAQSVG